MGKSPATFYRKISSRLPRIAQQADWNNEEARHSIYSLKVGGCPDDIIL